MKGFFENFLAVSVKKVRKVLMILPSITGPGRAFLAESCCYMPCLGIRKLLQKLDYKSLSHNYY